MENNNYEIKVLIPERMIDVIENVDVTIYFKEKANCKKFTDREGVHYITGLKQEGKEHVEQED